MMLYTMKEAAERLGVTYAVLQGQMFHGKIPAPAMKAGRSRLFSEAELEAARLHFEKRKSRLGR